MKKLEIEPSVILEVQAKGAIPLMSSNKLTEL